MPAASGRAEIPGRVFPESDNGRTGPARGASRGKDAAEVDGFLSQASHGSAVHEDANLESLVCHLATTVTKIGSGTTCNRPRIHLEQRTRNQMKKPITSTCTSTITSTCASTTTCTSRVSR